jgi:hypothetical protein
MAEYVYLSDLLPDIYQDIGTLANIGQNWPMFCVYWEHFLGLKIGLSRLR